MRTIYRAMFRCMLGLVGKTIRSASQAHIVLYGSPPSLRNPRVQPVRVAGILCISFILSVVSATGYADTVPPTYSTSAPPIVKYSGAYTNFDTPAAACTDQIAHSWDYTSQTGGVYDHTEPYTDNLLKCFATFYVNSNPVTSWWSIVGIMRSCDGRGWNNYPITCVRNVCPANSTGTPEINPTICTCDTGYMPDSSRTSCVPVNLTIRLEGRTTTEPSTLLPLNAVVEDQNGAVQSGKRVTITATVQDGTGGHIHSENRPKGTFTCSSSLGTSPASCTLTTDSSGQAPFIFVATPISGTHTISATCDGCSNTETKSVDVKVSGLIPIPASPQLYALQDSTGAVIGAIPGKHTANHYLTSVAITKLERLARIYIGANPTAKLYLNDASLEWGGLFDVGRNTPWYSPHSTHDKGKSLDMRAANSGPNNEGAVPATVFRELIRRAQRDGFRIGLHCRNSSDTNYCLGQPNNRHFHVDF